MTSTATTSTATTSTAMTSTRVLAAATALLLGLLVSCGDEAPADASHTVEVTAARDGEYRLGLPAEVASGATRLTLVNDGREAHHVQVLRLHDDADVADLEAALATGDPARAAGTGTFVGGTGLVSPGERSRADAVLDLAPGRYVAFCLVPDTGGVPHAARGMLQPFDVSPDGDAPAPAQPDASVALVDHRFEVPDRLDGSAVLDVVNTSAAEAHELVVAQLRPGAGVDELVAALDTVAPLPGVGLGGMQALPPGGAEQLRLRLDAGRYVLFCAVPAPDGTPHYRLGMLQEVTVT